MTVSANRHAGISKRIPVYKITSEMKPGLRDGRRFLLLGHLSKVPFVLDLEYMKFALHI